MPPGGSSAAQQPASDDPLPETSPAVVGAVFTPAVQKPGCGVFFGYIGITQAHRLPYQLAIFLPSSPADRPGQKQHSHAAIGAILASETTMLGTAALPGATAGWGCRIGSKKSKLTLAQTVMELRLSRDAFVTIVSYRVKAERWKRMVGDGRGRFCSQFRLRRCFRRIRMIRWQMFRGVVPARALATVIVLTIETGSANVPRSPYAGIFRLARLVSGKWRPRHRSRERGLVGRNFFPLTNFVRLRIVLRTRWSLNKMARRQVSTLRYRRSSPLRWLAPDSVPPSLQPVAELRRVPRRSRMHSRNGFRMRPSNSR